MQRQPFDRAIEFLRYSRATAWTAGLASVLTGVLFVGLLLILGLFADLTINRGEISCLADLSEAERARFLLAIQTPESADDKKDRAKHYGDLFKEVLYEDARLERLARHENPDQLSEGDRDMRRCLLWMLEIPGILRDRVGPVAADLVTTLMRRNMKTFGPEVMLNRNMPNQGLLGLVVRSQWSTQSWFVHPLARWNEWTWRHGNRHYLLGLLFFGFNFAILRALLFYSATVLAAKATLEAVTRLRRALYVQTYRLGTLAFRALGQSEAVSVSTRHIEIVHDGIFLWLRVYFREPVKFGLLLFFALLVNFWLAIAFLIFAALVWLIGGQIVSYFRRKVEVADHRSGDQLTLMQESLTLMRLVKVYLMEAFNQGRFERQLGTYARAQEQRYRGEAVYKPIFALLGTLAVLTLFYLAGHLLLNGHLGVASAMAMVTALVALYWPAVRWLDARRTMRRARDSAKVLFDFLDRAGAVGQAPEAEFLPGLSKTLEFDNVALDEPGTGRKLLSGVSFALRAGEQVAIVGPDELEKHALVYLISRFLDPNRGEIRIDKKNIRWVTIDSLRIQVATVLQHDLVFNDTIAHNIGCGDPSYNLARIIEAAKKAHAHQFIQKLPKGYETPIGELGLALDAGQKFRIALARAILRDPAIYVIEEPHNQLDEGTKSMIDDTFQRILPGRTAIFLPHRLSTLKHCDRVFLLHEGQIADQGMHRDLVKNNDLYRHLHYLEFNEFSGNVHTEKP